MDTNVGGCTKWDAHVCIWGSSLTDSCLFTQKQWGFPVKTFRNRVQFLRVKSIVVLHRLGQWRQPCWNWPPASQPGAGKMCVNVSTFTHTHPSWMRESQKAGTPKLWHRGSRWGAITVSWGNLRKAVLEEEESWTRSWGKCLSAGKKMSLEKVTREAVVQMWGWAGPWLPPLPKSRFRADALHQRLADFLCCSRSAPLTMGEPP